MRVKNKKVYYLKRKTVVEDNEGGKYPSYSNKPIEIKANISEASGRVQAEIYGNRLTYIKNMLYDEDIDFIEGDGICVKVGALNPPDYKVISIKEYTNHKFIELEKIL